jgi:tetratricopeptide (TPR) repeat protein
MRRTWMNGAVLIASISAAYQGGRATAQTPGTAEKPVFIRDDLDSQVAKASAPPAAFDAASLLRPPVEIAEVVVRSGWDALKKRHYPGAIATFDEAIRLYPWHAPAFYGRGAARFHRGDLAGAIADYDESIRLDGHYWPSRYGRGCALLRCGDYWAASDAFTEAIAAHPEIGVLYKGRAEARSRLRDAAGTRDDAERALALGEDDGRLEDLRLMALDKSGDDVKLRAALTEMVRSDTYNVERLAALAVLLASSPDLKVKDADRALGFATDAVAHSRGYSRAALRAKAAAHAALGDFPRAVGTSFRAMFAQMPNQDMGTDVIRIGTYLLHKPPVKEVWDKEPPDRDRQELTAAIGLSSKTGVEFRADCDRAFWLRAALPRSLPIPIVVVRWNPEGVKKFGDLRRTSLAAKDAAGPNSPK